MTQQPSEDDHRRQSAAVFRLHQEHPEMRVREEKMDVSLIINRPPKQGILENREPNGIKKNKSYRFKLTNEKLRLMKRGEG